jgi:hypothetical protein
MEPSGLNSPDQLPSMDKLAVSWLQNYLPSWIRVCVFEFQLMWCLFFGCTYRDHHNQKRENEKIDLTQLILNMYLDS